MPARQEKVDKTPTPRAAMTQPCAKMAFLGLLIHDKLGEGQTPQGAPHCPPHSQELGCLWGEKCSPS